MSYLKYHLPELLNNLIKLRLRVALTTDTVLAAEQLLVHCVKLSEHRLDLFALGFHCDKVVEG